jgi:putative ABC transport system permease protein
VKTISGANKQLLADKLTKISNENKDAEHQNEEVIINLTALKNLHIYNPDKEIPNVAKLAPILKLLFFLALLILIITIVNYTNLTVAQIFERKRFYGIHKMMGSGRIKILIHYLYHSGINYYAGIFFAICIMSMALPSVNNLFNLDISLSILTIKHVLFAFLFTVFIFIVISIYPLSEIFKLNESHAIKENNQRIGGVNIRKILIAAQFFITFLIVTTTLIIIKQSKFLINKEIGVQTNNRLILKTDHVNKDFFETKKEAFKQNLERVAEINITTVTNALPGNSYYVDNFWMPDQGAESKFFMKDICVDGNYIPAMGLELIAGRNFDKNPTTESDIIILSESAVKVLGFENPADAINEFVFKGAQNRNYRIVGVVKDFLFSSYESNNYGTLRFSPSENRFACIKYSGNKHYEILGAVEKEWKKMFSDIPFRYFYLDDKYEERFVDDITKAKATLIFSTIAIILAAIGLFGISYFTVLKREKEFGIRKINGAKISEVFYLIFAEFSKIVVIVCLFAIPVAYWLASIILVDYTFKIDLKWWLFIIPLLLIFFISIISVTYHAFKLALMNPIKIIRE